MKIGIVSDGKFGDRAFEVIKSGFPETIWIDVPFPASQIVDDLVLDVPDCDLYISYARHPDVVLALLEKRKPTILGISFGPGFLRDAKRVNEDLVAPVTMCSLEDTTWSEEINAFARVFGRPGFKIDQKDGIITTVQVIRGAPCGSTWGAAEEMGGRPVSREELQHFGLRICHFCRAPRFGRTCDKEFSGVHHIREFIRALRKTGPLSPDVEKFAEEIEGLHETNMKAIGNL
ncbi:MAG: hypothetical protein LUQ25_09065 [Methanoregulaceae archaeon]|nr:hypothetical protein [Methanoregulaceae archaeon]